MQKPGGGGGGGKSTNECIRRNEKEQRETSNIRLSSGRKGH